MFGKYVNFSKDLRLTKKINSIQYSKNLNICPLACKKIKEVVKIFPKKCATQKCNHYVNKYM